MQNWSLQLRRWRVWRVRAMRDERWERSRRKDERLTETGLKASPARPLRGGVTNLSKRVACETEIFLLLSHHIWTFSLAETRTMR